MVRVLAILAIAFVLFTVGQIDAGAPSAWLLAILAAALILTVLLVVSRRQARS